MCQTCFLNFYFYCLKSRSFLMFGYHCKRKTPNVLRNRPLTWNLNARQINVKAPSRNQSSPRWRDRISQQIYLNRNSISRICTHPQSWNLRAKAYRRGLKQEQRKQANSRPVFLNLSWFVAPFQRHSTLMDPCSTDEKRVFEKSVKETRPWAEVCSWPDKMLRGPARKPRLKTLL